MTSETSGLPRSPSGIRTVALSVLLLAAGALPLEAQEPAGGPLRTSVQNPLYRLFHVPEGESADVVGHGRLRVELTTAYSNIFERSESDEHRQLFDLERMTNTLTLRYGVSPSLEVGGRMSVQTGWGGFLDSFVTGFHGALGLPNGDRDLEPDGQYRVLLERDDPRVSLDLEPRTLAPEDARLFAKWRFLGSPASPGALSLRGALRRSAGPLEPGRLSTALALLGRLSKDDVHLHLGAGGANLEPPAALAPISSGSAAFLLFAVEARIRPGTAFVGQMTGSSRYVGGFEDGELDHVPTNLAFGLNGRTAGGWLWEVSFAEDFPPDSPSVDFTVGLHLGRTF